MTQAPMSATLSWRNMLTTAVLSRWAVSAATSSWKCALLVMILTANRCVAEALVDVLEAAVVADVVVASALPASRAK